MSSDGERGAERQRQSQTLQDERGVRDRSTGSFDHAGAGAGGGGGAFSSALGGRRSAGAEAVAGAVTGVVSRTLIAPMDVIKIRLQLYDALAARDAQRGAQARLQHVVSTLWREGGVFAFFRGNVSALLLYGGYAGVQFPLYGRLVREWGSQGSWAVGAAGGVAGVVATVLTYPFDVLRTRFATQGVGPGAHRSLWAMASAAVRAEGPWRGLFPGLTVTVLEIGLRSGVMFLVYEAVCRAARKWAGTPTSNSTAHVAVAGASAGLLGKLAVYPMDTVRRFMQTRSMFAAQVKDPALLPLSARLLDVFSITQSIYREHGLLGFFRGAVPAVAKSALSATIVFTLYDSVLSLLDPPRGI
jgi:solute carrier family 25 (mitochondrial thiamine pyrophosphate transporter), member 19